MSTFPDEPSQVEQLADEAFGSIEAANAWLRSPNPMLLGETPLDTARTSAGAKQVANILMAIRSRSSA